MGQLFNIDSKFMAFMSKLADLLLLNFLTVICCLPIFTIGASFTAMHTVLIAIHRNENGGIIKDYFKAFASNFKQATVIWLIILVCATALFVWFYLIVEQYVKMPNILVFLLIASAALMVINISWVFVLQARYINPIWHTLKNSLIVGISHIGITIAMVLIFLVPFAIAFAVEGMEPIVLCMGFTFPGALQVKLYHKVIEKMDAMILPNDEEQEAVIEG